MKILLDTHILLWWLSDDKQLSKKARETIISSDNLIVVSAVSAWEISIKKTLGKLQAPDDLEAAIADSGFQPLAIDLSHAQLAGALPSHHADPFDRMLVAQATIEELSLMTHDKRLVDYETTIFLV